MASKVLVALAKQAAEAAANSATANRAWRDAFAAEFGHEDISDALVEAVDYSRGNTSMLTAEFIDSNSAPGMGC